MRLLFTIMMIICLDSFGQSTPEKMMPTKVFNYNGWKIKTGSSLELSTGEKATIKQMSWYRYRGNSIVLADVTTGSNTQQIDLRRWIGDDKIKRPAGIKKMPQLPEIYSDDLIMISDTITTKTGLKIYRGLDLKLGKGTLANGDFKHIFLSRKEIISSGSPVLYAPAVWSGDAFSVKELYKIGNENRGYDYLIILGGYDFKRDYECNIETALETNEVVIKTPQ